MISAAQLGEAFHRNAQIIQMQAKGLSHEQSLTQLPFRANCLNWVIGHVVGSRNGVLRLLGEDPALDPALVAGYDRDSQPLSGLEETVLPLEELLAALDRGQERITAALTHAGEEELEREVTLFGRSTRRVIDWIFFLYFHDSFHTGETSILRQAAGTDDKVI
jgi:hypothetical protein